MKEIVSAEGKILDKKISSEQKQRRATIFYIIYMLA
jgi:hypothetical protein